MQQIAESEGLGGLTLRVTLLLALCFELSGTERGANRLEAGGLDWLATHSRASAHCRLATSRGAETLEQPLRFSLTRTFRF